MKRLMKLSVILGLAYATTTVSSFAQLFTFDENGHNNLSGFGPVPFTVAPDPSGGLPVSVLIYTLPFVVTSGDVSLLETAGSSPTNSDMVRFFTPTTGNTSDVIFYSDVESGDPNDLADTGVPFDPNATVVSETGPEGANGAAYAPGPGMPGFFASGSIQYNIMSDVPEPGTLALSAFGGGLLLAVLRRRRQ